MKRVSEEKMISRVTPDSWSFKDCLAHLTFYEQYMLNNVRLTLADELEIFGVTREEQANRNAQIFERNKDRPLNEVLADLD
jgi:hypothetical protein